MEEDTSGTSVRAAAQERDLVDALEDDALAQRPRADLQLLEVEDVHAGLGHERAGHDLVLTRRRYAGKYGELVGGHLDELGDPLRQVRHRQRALDQGAVARGRGSADPCQGPKRL